MGATISKRSKVKRTRTLVQVEAQKTLMKEKIISKMNEADFYDEDVIEAANLAIAIHKDDYTTSIELSLSCENLPKMDTFSLTDPMIIVKMEKEEKEGKKWIELGKTEIIPETINPKFMKTFVVSYNFEKQQKLKFEIYDIDSFQEPDNLSKQEFIGFVEADLHEIVCSPTQTIYKKIMNDNNKKRKNGNLVIKGSEYDINSSKYVFHLSAKGFNPQLLLFLRINCLNENNEYVPLMSTDPIKGQKKQIIEWNPFYISSNKIVNETDNIKFEVCEFNKSKGNQIIGDSETSLFEIFDKKKKQLNVYKNNSIVGIINIIKLKKISRNTFLNYIYAGTEISLLVAIDFSRSNKEPHLTDSLHNLYDEENDYIKAIKSIVGILQYYDQDNRIPLYGIGAKLPPFFENFSQCFALNGNYFNPEVNGIEDVVKYYKNAIKNVKFHGPQTFCEILKLAGEFASAEKFTNTNQKYYILLIMTNGIFNDLDFTIDEIVKLSFLPISIVFVGIGDGIGKGPNGELTNYFEKLKELDADENDGVLIDRNGQESFRDVVQFVNFNEVKDSLEKIAKETLAEIPKQFLEYMKKNKIDPLISENKELKGNSHDFMHIKIEEKKKGLLNVSLMQPPKMLKEKKKNLISKLLQETDYDQDLINFLLENRGLPAYDMNLVYELMNDIKQTILKNNVHYNVSPSLRKTKSIENVIKFNAIYKNPTIKHRYFRVRKGKFVDFYTKLKKNQELIQNKINDKSLLKKMNSDKSKDVSYDEFINTSIEKDSNNENLLKCTHINKEDETNEYFFEKKSIKINDKKESPKKEEDNKSIIKSPIKSDNNKKIKTRIFGINKKKLNEDNSCINYNALENVKDKNLCVICQENNIEMLNLPCGHYFYCKICFFGEPNICPLCNSIINNYVILN